MTVGPAGGAGTSAKNMLLAAQAKLDPRYADGEGNAGRRTSST